MSDKRALRNQYKETKVPMGVFVIKNTLNQRVYVGAATNVEGAINRNRFELTMKTHRNKKLLQDWLEHGAEHFVFEVIDTITQRDEPNVDYESELAAMREMWREEYQSYGENGYNRPKTVAGSAKLALNAD
ncbi:MAG: GIY-YIG nuclease family protein [Pseudomonadota bacterium]